MKIPIKYSKYYYKHIRKQHKKREKEVRKMGQTKGLSKQVENVTRLNPHDLKVLGFHLVVVGVQAALVQLGIERPEWALFVNLAAEALRRIAV